MLLPEPAVLGYLEHYTTFFDVCQVFFGIFLNFFVFYLKRLSFCRTALYFYAVPTRAAAMKKYKISATVSTRVVIKGDAITAGSRPIPFAAMGRSAPVSFAIMTVAKSASATARATARVTSGFCIISLSTRSTLAKATDASTAPVISPQSASFNIIGTILRRSISPSDMLRITVTETWAPELPPVSISIGTKRTRTVGKSASNLLSIAPESVAEIIRSKSQGIRARKSSTGEVLT